MASNATSSDVDADADADATTRRQVDVSSDEELRTDDDVEDEDEEMGSNIRAVANGNEDGLTTARTGSHNDGDGNDKGDNEKTLCSHCNVPWCDGKWHTVQRDVMDSITKHFFHPGLAWSSYVARCNFEVKERKRRQCAYEANLNNQAISKRHRVGYCEGGGGGWQHEQSIAVSDEDTKELDVLVILPHSNNAEKLKGYFIGSSNLDENHPNWRCLIAIVEVNLTLLRNVRFILSTNEDVPSEVISWSRKFRQHYQHLNRYNDGETTFANASVVPKSNGSNVVYLPFFGQISNEDFHSSLKDGLLMVNHKQSNRKWSFRVALREGLWYGNGNDIASLNVFERATREFGEEKGLRLKETRGLKDGNTNATHNRILSIAKAAKYGIGETYSSKNALLKALQETYNAPTIMERCLAYLLNKSNTPIGSIRPCGHESNKDIDVSQILDKTLKKKIKNAIHSRSK